MIIRLGEDGLCYESFEFSGFLGGTFRHVSPASDGGAIITGYVNDDYGLTDILLVKMDAEHNPEWAKVYGTMDEEEGCAVKECDDGYIVAGYSETVDHSRDGILLRVDSDGNMQWCRAFGGGNFESLAGVECDPFGFIAAGDTCSFVPTPVSLILKADDTGFIPGNSYSRDYTANMYETVRMIDYELVIPNQLYHPVSQMVDITGQFTAIDQPYIYTEQN
jgi:hypothetical protein